MSTRSSYNRTKRLTWEPSYVDRDAMYPPEVSAGIHFKDWDAWDDPFQMSYRKYLQVQAKKEITFHPTREAFARYDEVKRVDRRWFEGLKILYPYLLSGEYGANRSHARVSRYAPAPALRAASFYQAIDELRHSQNHLYESRLFNQTEEGFANWAYWRARHFLLQPARAVFEDIVACDNIFEAIVALNFCTEVGLTNLIFIAVPMTGVLNGDTTLAQEFLTTQSDETRHMAIGQSTIRTLLQGDDRNREVLQYWFDKWFWLNHRGVASPVSLVVDYFGRNKALSFKEAFQRYVVENFVGGLVDDLSDFGFQPPRFLPQAMAELDDTSHSLFRVLYQYKHVLFNKVFQPLDSDIEFFEAKYPGWNDRHGHFWSEVAAGDPKDLASLPMLCQVCRLPCVYPVPEHPTIQVREYNGTIHTFCSEPCAWIFDHEPVRYSKTQTMDRVLNGMDVPELRRYMGLNGPLGGELEEVPA